MEKVGFFEVEPGNSSSSRLTAFIVIMVSLSLAVLIIVVGCVISFQEKSVSSLIAAAGAAGTEFGVIAGAAMFYMWGQKKQEIQQEINKTV